MDSTVEHISLNLCKIRFIGAANKSLTTHSIRVNVTEGEECSRAMTTGQHTVRDIYCCKCGVCLGWKYVRLCHPSSKHVLTHYMRFRNSLTSPLKSTRRASIFLSVTSSSMCSEVSARFRSSSAPSHAVRLWPESASWKLLDSHYPWDTLVYLSTTSTFVGSVRSSGLLLSPSCTNSIYPRPSQWSNGALRSWNTQRIESLCGALPLQAHFSPWYVITSPLFAIYSSLRVLCNLFFLAFR
jgi:hypothetical protein